MMMKNFPSSPLNNNQTQNHIRDRNNKKYSSWLSAVPLRFSLRGYGFCMATLFLFCFGSLVYQLNGGPPTILLDIRQYLGESTFQDDHGPPVARVLPFPSQVVYNRVGKCGSRTVLILLRLLSEKHQFNLVSSEIHNRTRLTKHEQVDLIKNISNMPQPFLYTRHVHFLNFTRFRVEEPVYINIIRDPINRFLSNYFFRRFGDWRGEQNHLIRTPGMKDDERYLDINVCILENYPECSNPRMFYIIPYFCGQHPQCREPGVWALERAKQNVLENYLLVGILEELEDVLLLLERLLPHFFSGVLNIYKSPDYKKAGNMTGTVRKHTPTLEALQVLYHRMRYEYDFYGFVRDQFHLAKKKIGLKSASRPSAYSHDFLRDLVLRTPEPMAEEDDEEEEEEEEEEAQDTTLEDAASWLVNP
ncbi:uronyl 2-sulfotransferase a isoform X2 [Gadus morhua]|uniref:Uronyl 2-sulfotransferase a n=1 Tax=Gadus morhua TaxID=8049 RepID=A0A8C5F439_GADMO|nr:uronyl 2-sulfotransferase isoform X2 [Gadus morhua]XP_056437923.1 uronyl 2-sulfotransferase-like isoform X2 [Gadus chalcogrammus]